MQAEKCANPTATVVVASTRGLVQAGMAALLRDLPQLRHVHTAANAADAARSIAEHQPDVLVLDHDLAGELRQVCEARHRPRVLLISRREHLGADPACGSDCACGLVPDRAPSRHIRAALKIIGGCNSSRLGDGWCTSCPLRGSLAPPRLPLSAREQAVFERIGLGESNLQIAARFGRSVKTIEAHRENIKRKLGFETSGALVEAATAWRRGELIEAPEA